MKHKNFRPQHAPRPTKGELVLAAKAQAKADEAKAKTEAAPLPPVDENAFVTRLPEPVNGAAVGEVKPDTTPPVASTPAAAPPTEEAVLAAAITGDQKAAAEAIVAALPTPAPTEAKTTVRAPKGTDPSGLYALGKKYVPKTDRNSETWGKITKALAEGPKTMKELAEVVKGHGDFLGYMTRGGHIVPHKVEEAKA